jgi:hypothetical protein
MDSDAKELGHVRVADRKTAWGYQGWNVIIHSCVGNSTPNRKFVSDSRVNSRSQSTPIVVIGLVADAPHVSK